MSFADLIPADLNDRQYVKLSVMARYLQMSSGTIRQMIKDGTLPEPVLVTRKVHLLNVGKVRQALRLLEETANVESSIAGQGDDNPLPLSARGKRRLRADATK